MVFAFRQEARSALRRRVGRILYPKDFLHGAVLSATANTVVINAFKARADNSLRGRRAHVVAGLGANQEALVTANTVGTGSATVAPAWATQPDATSYLELWPDNLHPDAVNDALNQAVLHAHDMCAVADYQDDTNLAADRLSLPLDADLIAVIGAQYQDAGGSWRPIYYSQDPVFFEEWDYAFRVVGSTAYFNRPLPDDRLDFRLDGYRHPATLASDSDLCEIHPDYLALMAAYFLEAGDASGPALDPEQHAGRAGNWLASAREILPSIATRWKPGTVPL